jgi:hypothetical protein
MLGPFVRRAEALASAAWPGLKPWPSVRLGYLVLLLALCAACESGAPAQEQAGAPAITWRALGTWSGRGSSQTGSFNVETGALRLRWETRNERASGAGRFRVSLHSAISGRPLQIIVDHTGIGADTTFLQDDPRVSYLVIESSDVDWTASLDEAIR